MLVIPPQVAAIIPLFFLMVQQCLADHEPPGTPRWRAAYHAYLDYLVQLGWRIPSHWWTEPIPYCTWWWFTLPVGTSQERAARRRAFIKWSREWRAMLDRFVIYSSDTGVGCMIGLCQPLRTGQEGHHAKGVHPDSFDIYFDECPWDYEAPLVEDVLWVCINCHHNVHAKDLHPPRAANDNRFRRRARAANDNQPIKQRDLVLKAKK